MMVASVMNIISFMVLINIKEKWQSVYAIDLKSFDRGLIPLFSYDPHQYIHTYKNSQTTSTKCQYQAAASNPKWWWLEKWWFSSRKKQTVRKVEPMIT